MRLTIGSASWRRLTHRLPLPRRLRDEVAKAAAAPDVVDRLDQQGMEAVASEPGEWGAYLKSELDRYAKIIKDTGIKPK